MSFGEVVAIELGRLVPHPDNANVMSAEVMRKLRGHIARTGRYEPLLVRPHPGIRGAFQLINGHHRKEALAALGHEKASCVVWPLDDAEALLLLATVNRLGGEDAPGKRLELLEKLAAATEAGAERLAEMVPEGAAALRALLERTVHPVPAAPPSPAKMPEALTIFLQAQEKEQVLRGLRATARDLRAGLLQWAAMWEEGQDRA